MKPLLKLTIFVMVAASGCKISNEYNNNYGNDKESLIINYDGTFIFETTYQATGNTVIKGEWKRDKDILTLNSFDRPQFEPNTIEEKLIPNQTNKLIIFQEDAYYDGTIISINNGQEIDTLRWLETYVNDDHLLVTGVFSKIDSIKTISVIKTFCLLRDSIFSISNPSSNYIRIYPHPYNYYPRMKYLTNVQWKVEGNIIYYWKESEIEYSTKKFLTRK